MNTPSVGTADTPPPTSSFALFELGFRPFFLAAGLVSILATGAWTLVMLFGIAWPSSAVTPMQWHGHEMIYGYAIAVVAGFLLTAVRNWTGLTTPNRRPLFGLFALWFLARVCFFAGGQMLFIAAVLDIAFFVFLLVAVSIPILKAKQWKQIAILSKLLTIGICNLCFYLGIFNAWELGIQLGLYGGVYIVVSLILTMGRRVVPFFIEKGVGYEVTLRNSKWLDILSLLLMIAFVIFELFTDQQEIVAATALALFLVHARRLFGWHTPGIWRKPLLWSLYLSFWFLCFGFLLFAASALGSVSKMLALHAFTYGGIGIVTISMMSRVALGHTGNNVGQPPAALSFAFAALIVGAVVRVAVPLIDPSHYSLWLAISQLLWMVGFATFVWIFAPMLIRPRADGKPG